MAEIKDKNDIEQKNYLRDRTPSRPMAYPTFPKKQPDMGGSFAPSLAIASGEANKSLEMPKSEESKKLTVGRDIVLNGEISTCDILVVQGKVEASLKQCKNLEIDTGGEFRGTVTVDQAEINGLFDGQLTVNRRLVVRSNGRVNGKIRYHELEIERGGILSGTVEPLMENKDSFPLLSGNPKPKSQE